MKSKNTHHIKDLVYGATDGIITTFAVVAGVVGGDLTTAVILIVGFANLLADGFSMAASNYLGTKSEHDAMREEELADGYEFHHPVRSGMFTFIAFVVAGLVPLLPFIFMDSDENRTFFLCILATAFALFIVGALRSIVTKKGAIKSGLEILLVGGVAAAIAFFVGWLIRTMIG